MALLNCGNISLILYTNINEPLRATRNNIEECYKYNANQKRPGINYFSIPLTENKRMPSSYIDKNAYLSFKIIEQNLQINVKIVVLFQEEGIDNWQGEHGT